MAERGAPLRMWLLLSVAALAGCVREADAALDLVLQVPAGSLSGWVKVVAGGAASGCVQVKDPPLEIGIGQGALPTLIDLEVTGYTDASCTTATVPAETARLAGARFVHGKVTTVQLTLASAAPRVETLCSDQLDDDGDGLVDCADPDCEAQPCSNGNACVLGQQCSGGVCMLGAAVTCNTPPPCHAASGSCLVDAGCRYLPDVGAPCDDGDACTTADSCSGLGTCAGARVSCTSPPGPQCWDPQGTCGADGGCGYQRTPGARCDDGQACTVDDRCEGDGGCTGSPVACPELECRAREADCAADGGCRYALLDAGAPCPGGRCDGLGDCAPAFPFVLSNLGAAPLPRFPDAGTVLDCGEVAIDTGEVDGAPGVSGWCVGQPDLAWVSRDQPGGPQLVVLAFRSLELRAGSTLRVRGARPAVLLSAGDLTVGGVLEATAGAQACPAAGAGGAPLDGGGWGGGGYGSSGAVGGLGPLGGAGGPPSGGTALVPLRGGCAGGPATAGGGALQLSAAGALVVSGTLSAPGQGGLGGAPSLGGEGAGSGGAVLLEGHTITVGGAVAANGGAGGQGGEGAAGVPGAAGSSSLLQAPGGVGGQSAGGRGGDGSAGLLGPSAGGDGLVAGGGGGGGAGRVRLNAVLGCTLGPGAVVTPAHTGNLADGGCGPGA